MGFASHPKSYQNYLTLDILTKETGTNDQYDSKKIDGEEALEAGALLSKSRCSSLHDSNSDILKNAHIWDSKKVIHI